MDEAKKDSLVPPEHRLVFEPDPEFQQTLYKIAANVQEQEQTERVSLKFPSAVDRILRTVVK